MKQIGLNGFSLKNKGSAVRFCLWPLHFFVLLENLQQDLQNYLDYKHMGTGLFLIGAIVVAVSAWLFVNLSPWIAAGFAISAALTWKIPKVQKNF